MKSSLLGFVVAISLLTQSNSTGSYKVALPGYNYEFPRDNFDHSDFRTEWWYYTGNIKAADGHRFGYELTFFRQGVSRDAAKASSWDVRDIYLAHLALSDLDGGKFYHAERTNRAGPGIAGVDPNQQRIWNGNWNVSWTEGDQKLRATDERFSLAFLLHPEKRPVIHGQDGISQKSAGVGNASHYISFTRIGTSGLIQLSGHTYKVEGLSWMDHEFFTQQLAADLAGWDWFSVQLNDNTELMLYRFRRRDGSADSYSSGTYIDAVSKTRHLTSADFALTPTGETWTRPEGAVRYPIHWKIVVPSLDLTLDARTPLPSQELTGKTGLAPNYWEGAITLQGQKQGHAAAGVGYLEMTGYDRAVRFGP
jgi:predicted secreted hydrolase